MQITFRLYFSLRMFGRCCESDKHGSAFSYSFSNTLKLNTLQGDVTLPSRAQMWEDIRAKEAHMAKQYVKSQRHTIQVDYIPFMDELAELVGCKPDIGKLPFPLLFYDGSSFSVLVTL